jgi:hypothetical protein
MYGTSVIVKTECREPGPRDGKLTVRPRETSAIVWTDYFRYRAELRGFDLAKVEAILRYGAERYRDAATGRRVVVGRHGESLVIMPYEVEESSLTPVTIHVTSRQQISLRIRSGRFTHEET